MGKQYDDLAAYFLQVPVDIYGVYQTTLGQGVYPGHKYQPATKDGIIIALKGEAVFIYDDKSCALSPGKAMIGGYNQRFELIVHSPEFEYFLVHFLPAFPDRDRSPAISEVSMLHIDMDAGLLQLMKQLRRYSAELGTIELLEKKTLFYQLIHKTLAHERYLQNSESHSMMEQTIEYIRQNYMEPLTLESLADQHGMKAKYFSHLFWKYTGIGPINYLIQYRMNVAHELLMTAPFSVRDIARSVGYADPYYFSRLFKKHYGMPPTAVRELDKGINPS